MSESSDTQRAALAAEYARVGFTKGELLPTPDPAGPAATPEGFLALLRSVPDGAGLTGYLEALRRTVGDRPITDDQ